MGYMTVVSFLNDGFDQLKEHPDQVVDNIINGGNRYAPNDPVVKDYPVGNFVNPMEVAESFHADFSNVFLAGKNSMSMLTNTRCSSMADICYQLEGIKEAKQLLNQAKKNIEATLEKIKQYKNGTKVKALLNIQVVGDIVCKAGTICLIVKDDNEELLSLLFEDNGSYHYFKVKKIEVTRHFEIIEE